jgi:hypothetical protein
MADSVNVEVLTALLKADYDPRKMALFLDQLTTAKAKSIDQAKEGDKLVRSFKSLAASLDPVIAKQQRHESQVKTLDAAYKKHLVTEKEYIRLLGLSKDRIQDNVTWQQRLGREIGSSLKSSATSYLAVGAAITAIGGTLVSVTKQTIKANLDAEASSQKVDSIVNRMGNTTGVTTKIVNDLAGALSDLSGKDDELLAESAAVLTHFDRIGKEIFPRVSKAALDMAVRTGTDIPSAFEKIGKMVNLPLKGLTLLERQGIFVSESQKKMAKEMLAAGDVAGAQGIVLGLLEKQYGGAAEAARDSLGGALEALGTTWENFLEEVGDDRLGPLRDGVEKLIVLVATLTDNVDDMVSWWYKVDIAIKKVLLTIGEVQLGAAEGPLARVLNPVGAANSAEMQRKALEDLRAGIKDAQKSLGRNALNILAPGIAGSLKELSKEHRAGAGAALEQTEAEGKLGDKLKEVRDAALEAVLASREDRENAEELLKARKLSIDAMELQKTVQEALAKAQKAGKAATSEQRLEIIRNTIASFQLRNAIEDVGERERQNTDLFKKNREELERETKILGELLDLLNQISNVAIQSSIDINISQVSSGGQEATDFTRARVDYVKEWRESWATATEVAQVEIEKVMGSLLTVEEKERAIAEIRIQLLDQQLTDISNLASGWQQFFSQIGSMFGGFAQKVSSVLSQIISTAQGFQSAGSAMSASGMAGLGGAVSSGAWFFAAAGALISVVRESNARVAQRQYSSSVDLGFGTGQIDVVGRRGRDVASALQSALDPILDVLGRVLSDLPNITILAREDGKKFKVQVYDTILGIFDSLEEAVDAAVVAAIDFLNRTSGLTDTIRQVLSATNAQTAEDLMRDLSFGQWYDNLGVGEAGQAIRDAFSEMRRGIDDALRLGLGIDKVKNWFVEQRREIIGGLLGVDYSASQALRNIQGAMEALSDLGDAERARLQEILESQNRELNDLVASGPRRDTETGRLESQEMWQREIDRLRAGIASYTAQLADIPAALSDQEIALGVWSVFEKYLSGMRKYSEESIKFARMRVDLEFKETKLALIQMGLWDQWASTWQDAYNSALAGAGRRQGGGNNNRQAVRDFISDRTFDLSLRSMSDLDAAMAQLNREYDEQVKQAGRNSEEIRRLNALRQQEITLLQQENNTRVRDSVRSFLGIDNAFSQIRDTASDLIQDIKDSALGNPQKAKLISQVLADIDRQIGELSSQEAVSLFQSLYNDLQKYGASEQVLSSIRQQSMFIEHQLNLDNYRKRIALLKIEGNLPAAIISALEIALGELEGVDLTTFLKDTAITIDNVAFTDGNLSGNFESSVTDVKDELNNLAEAFKDAKDGIRSLLSDISLGDLGIINPVDAFNEAKKQYQDTLSSARSGNIVGFQAIDDVGRQYIEALKTFSPELAAIELPKIKSDLSSLLNLSTVRDNNLIYTEKFANNQKVTNDTLMSGFTDLSNSNHMQTEIQIRMLTELSTLNTNQSELNARLARLETSGYGNKSVIGR